MIDTDDLLFKSKLVITSSPNNVGQYNVTEGFAIGLSKKPNWWHRLWTRVFFGWVWVDIK